MSGLSSPLFVDSITPLGAAGEFDGPWISVLGLGFSYLVAISDSDQSGTLYIEQSIDGVYVYRGDKLATTTDVSTALQSALLKVPIGMPFVRARYVNGATPQTVFVLSRRLLFS